jgi:hypothetical protein
MEQQISTNQAELVAGITHKLKEFFDPIQLEILPFK